MSIEVEIFYEELVGFIQRSVHESSHCLWLAIYRLCAT